MGYISKQTPEKLALARSLRAEGKTLLQIATTIGICKTTVLFWLDPEPAKRRKRYSFGAEAGGSKVQEFICSDAMTDGARKTGEELLRLVPKDTRTLAQKLMGEPIFERSALAQRIGASEP
jgi:hypothetical protein